jgi:hypothetical protein
LVFWAFPTLTSPIAVLQKEWLEEQSMTKTSVVALSLVRLTQALVGRQLPRPPWPEE